MEFALVGLGKYFELHQYQIIAAVGKSNIKYLVDKTKNSVQESRHGIRCLSHAELLKKKELSSLSLVICTSKYEEIFKIYTGKAFSINIVRHDYQSGVQKLISLKQENSEYFEKKQHRLSVRHKTVLITGTTSGIGEELAKNLLRLGAKVHGVARGHATILHKNYTHHRIDLSNLLELQCAKNIFNLRYDAVYLNAGQSEILEQVTPRACKKIEEMAHVNFLANVVIIKKLEKRWNLNRSSLIYTSTNIRDSSAEAYYKATKLATEVFLKEITENSENKFKQIIILDPGWVKTRMGGKLAPHTPSTIIPGFLIPFITLSPSERIYKLSVQDYAGLEHSRFIEKLKALEYFY